MKTNTIHKTLYFLSMTGIFFALGTLFYVGYLLFWPYKIAEYPKGPLKILNENKVVKVGEKIQYELSYCKYTYKQPDTTRALQGSIVYTLPEIFSNYKLGCNKVVINSDTVPDAVPPGQYTLHIKEEYRVNVLRTVTYEVYTEVFNVVK